MDSLQYHRSWESVNRNGCVLYLPFWRYGANAQKIWDQSGQHNDGTIIGAVPYPGNPRMTSQGSTFNRGDFTATNAFFWSSLDLSSYAGSDLGSTPYRIELTDGAGKKATGYIGAVGAGETLESELITEWTNEPMAYETFTIAGKNITSAIEDGVAGGQASSNNTGFNSGELLKFVNTITLNSGQLPLFYYKGWTQYFGQLLSGLNTIYHNTLSGAGANTKYGFYNTVAANWSAINSSKRVTDPPSTAVHIVSSLNGTTRNWASIESGFDPNTIASWKINRVIPDTCIGWYFDDVDDRIVHPSINFGKTNTLLYWIRSFANAKDIIHGGAANYHVAIDGTKIYYNAGATELSQAHGGGIGNPTMIGIGRNGTTVQFFKNGVQVGANQIIDANNDLTLTTLGSYDAPGTFVGGVILETIGLNRALSAIEIKSYYDLTRGRYGV